MIYSKNYEELNTVAQKRYREKLKIAGLSRDQYVFRDFSTGNSQLWPQVEYPDIFINATSSYTKEQLKAYKSLDGYNYFVQGWVGKVEVLQNVIHGDITVVVLKAAVKHSQSLSRPSLHPWIAAEKRGTILCAHCTCMAGVGEACSHIAALLFTAETNTRMMKNTSCTSLPCSWLAPSCKIEYALISKIDFTTPQKKRKLTESSSTSSDHAFPATTNIVEEPTEAELEGFLGELSKTGIKASILSIVPNFCDDFVPRIEKGILPRPLTDLYDKDFFEITKLSDLQPECERVFSSLTISSRHCESIEQATIGVSHRVSYGIYRAG